MKDILRALKSKSSIPSVSIILSTELNSFADRESIVLRLKKNILNAKTEMLQKFDAKTVDKVVEKLNDLIATIDYRHLGKGVGLFASEEFSVKVDFPLKVKDRNIITEGFVTADIQNAIDQLFDYDVLILSRKESKLFKGFGNKLNEVTNNFPISFEDDFQVSRTHPHSQYNEEESKVDQSRRDSYFRKIAKALNENNAKTPLVLMGAIENRSDFKNVAKHNQKIIAEISGNMDKKSIHELSKMAWEVISKITEK